MISPAFLPNLNVDVQYDKRFRSLTVGTDLCKEIFVRGICKCARVNISVSAQKILPALAILSRLV